MAEGRGSGYHLWIVAQGQRRTASGEVATYLTELQQAMQAVVGPALDEAVGLLLDARERGATVYFCGNGGSAS
ncbi:MAG TPA: hypothetical protein VHQ00_12025, partial [Chloroflexota bacterium]|nr:hypothetical protein [Chloroflexota bacterium]